MKNNGIIILLMGLIGSFISCQTEDMTKTALPDSNGQLLLRVSVPGQENPVTRSLSGIEEHYVNTLDILVFQETSSGEVFSYRTYASEIEDNNSTGSVRTFSVSLQASATGTETYRFVLLANLRDELNGLTFPVGESKTNTLAKITFLANQPWGTTGTKRYLPMWGESNGTHVVSHALQTEDIGTIYLLRSVARIDVGVNMTGTDGVPTGLTAGSFIIEEVQARNVSASGRAVPATANHDAAGGSSGHGVVTAPSLPSSVSNTYVSYSHTAAEPHGFHREIYVAETAKASNHFLLIKARYTPAGESPSLNSSWYKVCLFDPSAEVAEGTLCDLLRNHCYRVNITGVRSAGYATAAEAIAADPVNSTSLQVTFTINDQAGSINYVSYNGEYMIGSDKSVIEAPGHFSPQELAVITNMPAPGWSYAFTDSPVPEEGNRITWLQYADGSYTGANTTDRFVFRVSKNPDSENVRRGYIHLNAGTITHTIPVVQEPSIQNDPNCYMVKPGGKIEIPVRKAWTVWTDEVMGYNQLTDSELTGALSAVIIWQDGLNMISYDVRTNSSDLKESVIGVTAGPVVGNAVLGLQVGGVLRWSWHVWVTDYDPQAQTGGTVYEYNNGYRSYAFMDRNLGATTTTENAVTTLGFQYQWGRKDPFPGSYSTTDTNHSLHMPIYVGNSTTPTNSAISYMQPPATAADRKSNNLHQSIQNPLALYSSGSVDWYTTQSTIYTNNNLWSDNQGYKALFDPCPAGWRVPPFEYDISPWAVDLSNDNWNPAAQVINGHSWNNGWTFASSGYGGYYPAAGYTYTLYPVFSMGGGYYWTATAAAYSAYMMKFTASRMTPGGGESNINNYESYKSSGLSVRCVRDE